jgi:hypothetical protein
MSLPRLSYPRGKAQGEVEGETTPPARQLGDGGLPRQEIALDLQLSDLPVQIVNHLLRVLDRWRLAATRRQLGLTLHQLLLPAADRRMNPKLRRQPRQGLLPESAAIATPASNAAL